MYQWLKKKQKKNNFTYLVKLTKGHIWGQSADHSIQFSMQTIKNMYVVGTVNILKFHKPHPDPNKKH